MGTAAKQERLRSSITDPTVNQTWVIFSLAIPTILEQFCNIAAHYVDAAMVGGLGKNATAAIAINASTNVLLNGFVSAVGLGLSVLVARSIGAREWDRTKRVVGQSLALVLVFGVLITAAMQVVGRYSPAWLGAEPGVVPDAVAYIRIVTSVFLFRVASVVFAALLRGAGDTRAAMMINLGANLVNIMGNLILIPQSRTVSIGSRTLQLYGAGLGVSGAAIATAGSMIFSGAVLFLYILVKDTPVRISLRQGLFLDRAILRETWSLSLPVAFERVTLAIGQIALTAMVAGLGTAAVASHYIVNTLNSIAYEAIMGFSIAATTLVAQCTGAGLPEQAYSYARRISRVGLTVMVGFSLLILATSSTLVHIFTSDETVLGLSAFIAKMDAVSEPFYGMSVILCGIFRGYGDTKLPFYVTLVGIIVIRLSFGYLFGYALALGLIGVWMGIFIDIIFRGIVCNLHFKLRYSH